MATGLKKAVPAVRTDPLVELAARLAQKTESIEEPTQKADLLCRLGLLCWDVLRDLEAAGKYLTEAGTAHPDALRLRLHLSISTGDQQGLQDLQRSVGAELTDREAARQFYRMCAETWLFHFGDLDKAIQAAREALRRDPSDEASRSILTLALELTDNQEELVKHLRTASGQDVSAHRRFATISGDLLDKPDDASKTLRRLRSRSEGDVYLLERIWEIAESGRTKLPEKDSAVALLQQKLKLLSESTATDEQEAAQFRLAQILLEIPEKEADAEVILEALSESARPWGATAALQLRRSRAIHQSQKDRLAILYVALADRCSDKRFKVAYLLRAGELYEAQSKPDQALDTYARLLLEEPGNLEATIASERLLLGLKRYKDLIEVYELAERHDPELQGRLLRRAAHIAESRLGDAIEAARLRSPTLESQPSLEVLSELGRIYREAHDLERLLRFYSESITHLQEAGEDRRRALYCSAAGVVALSRDQIAEADRYLSEALKLAPSDLFAHTALLDIYRRGKKWRQLVGAIQRELEFEHPDDEQARLHMEIGRIALENLKDLDLAEKSLTQAEKLRPKDPSLHHLLAQVYDARKNFKKAIELRRKAVEGFGSSFRSAVLLCEIGEIHAQQLKDDVQAEKAFREALEVDDEMDAAIEALSLLYRRKGRYDELIKLLESRLELTDEPDLEAQLHLEIGEVAERNLRQSPFALEHYRSALELDPESAVALDGLERICRRDGSWEVLAESLEPLAGDPLVRRLLIEALEHLNRWSDVRMYLEEDLDSADEAEDVAELAARIAEVCEKRLDDPQGALSMARRAAEAAPKVLSRQEHYRRLAERLGMRDDLILVFRRTLELLPGDDVRRVEIHRELGRLLAEDPEQLVEAVRVLEAGVSVAPEDREILDALALAYEKQERGKDLLAILQRRAEVASDPQDQVQVLLRMGKIHEAQDANAEALEAYIKAFYLDPGDRETFTVVERLCYRLKRWRDVMEVYDRAIELVEQRSSRSYRLSDLYARRGQLQLQYLSQTGEAAASYLKVMELDPGNDTSLKFLESIFSKENDWSGLIGAYEKRAELLRDVDKKVETLRRAARVAAAKLKDADEAARHYEAIHLLAPDDGESLDALERYFERSRNWEKLIAVLQARLKQIDETEEMVPLHMRIGTIYEEGLRNVDEAINNYKKVLELASGHREALEALGRIYEATERWAEFIDITRRQIRITQDRSAKALLYFKCGSVMEAKFSKSDDAIRYYDAAIKTSSSCLPAVHGLRDLYLRREDWPKVLETLELEVKLWQVAKERAGVYARMGRIYQQNLNDIEKAIQYYESALSVEAECMPAIRSLFDIAFQRKEWDRAATLSSTLSQKALRDGEPAQRSDFYFKRGVVARNTGDYQQAAENLVVALEIRPENLTALDAFIALCRARPSAYDFVTTFRALEKVYQRRDWPESQARVLVARGTLLEHEADLDTSIESYRQAVNMAPSELGVLLPLVELLVRLWRPDEALNELEAFAGRLPPDHPAVIDALLKSADILSNVLRDSRRAAATLRVILKRQPRHREALYRHAQELLVQGRHDEARVVCDRLIEVAADPKDTAAPEELGRYYYFLGHIAMAVRDDKTAASSYRRALDLSPGYPPAAIALARRHAVRKALPQAEGLLSNAARVALERGSARDSLLLRRHLALLQSVVGNSAAALAELRAVVATGDCVPDDRIALARLYAEDPGQWKRAIEELRHVLGEFPDNLQALQMLADLYPEDDPTGQLRPLRVMSMLGRASEAHVRALQKAEAATVASPRGILTDELRAKHLAVEEVRGPLGQIWLAVRENLEQLYPITISGEGLRPFDAGEAGFSAAEVGKALGYESTSFEILVSPKVGQPVAILYDVVPKVVIQEELLGLGPQESRFVVARALEYLKSGFSLLSRVGPRERKELGMLLKSMARPEDQREPSANEFMSMLSRKQVKAVERVAKAAGDVIPDLNVLAWMKGVDLLMSRVGLLHSDNLGAACRVLARMNHVEAAVSGDGRVVFRAISGGQNLLRFYLSSNYYELRAVMEEAEKGLNPSA